MTATHVRLTNQVFPQAFAIPLSDEMTITQFHVPVDDGTNYWYAFFTSFGGPVDKPLMREQRLKLHELPEYRPRVGRGNGDPPDMSARELADLQRHLHRLGYDVGKIDGKLGTQTRDGVKKAQIKFGLPADSYPTPELLDRLRR